MKIKKFKNIWTMGLILFGVILGVLYLIKLINPSFVITIAEVEPIVNFGAYVDTHKWAHYLFNSFVSFFVLYFYCCACIRTKKLDYKELSILLASIIFYCFVEEFLPSFLFVYNNILYILLPFIFILMRKDKDIKVMISTSVCFIITSLAQVLSLNIRGISTLISYPNAATLTILAIDAYIWNVLLYCFYNYKKENKNEKD